MALDDFSVHAIGSLTPWAFILHVTFRFSRNYLTKTTVTIVVLSGVNTSRPTVSVYESRKVHAGLIFTRNPDVTWTMKMCSMD